MFQAKSKVHKNNLNPVLEFEERFLYDPAASPWLHIQLFDDDIGKDENLGAIKVGLR